MNHKYRADPPRTVQLLVKCALFLSTLLVLKAVAELQRLPLDWLPLITSLALVVLMPQSEAARPKNVAVGHLLSWAVGACFSLLSWSPVYGATTALALMIATRALHPPAAVTPFVIYNHPEAAPNLFIAIGVGVVVLSIIQAVSGAAETALSSHKRSG